ncbi:ankyrin [Metarhizium album ARSEF 1941]|uniref:Ankyrin n=1 Tax=Metarhizium album (strain ARSEF 1941) TaxID=1081103 RepID=A0A0B2WGP1_METAS|nr:ankyrin [Metarhizium album ARSEF 1941]KHN95171.1 ankyrin [Metarhizium album ARSEF 1941]
MWKRFCQLLRIAYHPETDGATERMNREVEEILRIWTNCLQENWLDLLPIVMATVNGREATSTGLRLFFLMQGYAWRLVHLNLKNVKTSRPCKSPTGYHVLEEVNPHVYKKCRSGLVNSVPSEALGMSTSSVDNNAASPLSTTRPVPLGMDGRLWMQMKAASNNNLEARLHACVRDKDMSKLRELLPLRRTGELDLNHCDLDFGSALQVAVPCVNMTAAGILLDAGANPWAFNSSAEPQTSALDMAIQTGNRDMFTRICEKMASGSDEISQQRYRILLDRTALTGQAAMVEDVLGWAGGWSEAALEHALENAVSAWHVEVVRLLLDRFDYSPLCIGSSPHLSAGRPASGRTCSAILVQKAQVWII